MAYRDILSAASIVKYIKAASDILFAIQPEGLGTTAMQQKAVETTQKGIICLRIEKRKPGAPAPTVDPGQQQQPQPL